MLKVFLFLLGRILILLGQEGGGKRGLKESSDTFQSSAHWESSLGFHKGRSLVCLEPVARALGQGAALAAACFRRLLMSALTQGWGLFASVLCQLTGAPSWLRNIRQAQAVGSCSLSFSPRFHFPSCLHRQPHSSTPVQESDWGLSEPQGVDT